MLKRKLEDTRVDLKFKREDIDAVTKDLEDMKKQKVELENSHKHFLEQVRRKNFLGRHHFLWHTVSTFQYQPET